MESSRVREWVEAGKQVGKSFWREENGENVLVMVGIQKWNGKYKLHTDKVKEVEYWAEGETEETIEVDFFEDLAALVEAKVSINLNELTPLKGQKIFNPAF